MKIGKKYTVIGKFFCFFVPCCFVSCSELGECDPFSVSSFFFLRSFLVLLHRHITRLPFFLSSCFSVWWLGLSRLYHGTLPLLTSPRFVINESVDNPLP